MKELLSYYELDDTLETVRDWYDGYQFGTTSIYCPWDVIKYVQALLKNKNALPENYWANTSGNAMVRQFIDKADQNTRDEIEQLIAGESVVKEIRQDLTYNELDAFCSAILAEDEEKIQTMLTNYLKQTISIRDTNVKKERKENLPSGKATAKGLKEPNPSVCFFHGILLGLLSHRPDWGIKSNEESGDGYSDILIRDMTTDTGVVIEVKYAEQGNFDFACKEALEQIETTNYAEVLYDEGMEKIIKYGMAFYKKRCKVVRG